MRSSALVECLPPELRGNFRVGALSGLAFLGLVSTAAALVWSAAARSEPGPSPPARPCALRNFRAGPCVWVASVLRLMLRPALIALLALLWPRPRARPSTRNKILRECQDGGLNGDYTAREIRDARNNIPDDIDQYSDCRDVLTRAR